MLEKFILLQITYTLFKIILYLSKSQKNQPKRLQIQTDQVNSIILNATKELASSIMQEQINEDPSLHSNSRKSMHNKSRDSSKRSRQVNEKQASEYLKRPINKVSDPNKDLKNAYGKKHLEDSKFNYIHKLKQIRKTGDDSVSQHGDTDDQDFDVNQLSNRGKNKKESKTRTKVSRHIKRQLKGKGELQSYDDKESQIIADQSYKEENKLAQEKNQIQTKEEASYALKNNQKNEVGNNNQDQATSENQELSNILDKKSNLDSNQNKQKSSSDSQQSQTSQHQSSEKSAPSQQYAQKQKQQKGKRKDQKNGKIARNGQSKKEQSASQQQMESMKSQQSQKSEIQDKQLQQDLADRIKNVLNSQSESEEIVRLATFKKPRKKKGRNNNKLNSRAKNRQSRVSSLTKQKKLSKKNTDNVIKTRNSSTKNEKDKSQQAKIQTKNKNHQQNKGVINKAKKQEAIKEPIKTRGMSKIQENPIIIEDKQQVPQRMTRKRKNKYAKQTQLNLKGEVADMTNPPPFVQEKSKSKQERSKGEEINLEQPAKLLQAGQQKLDKFMVKISESPIQSPKPLKRINQNEKSANVSIKPCSPQQSDNIQEQIDKAIIHFIDQRRKNLKITSRIIVQSLLYYQSQKRHQKVHNKHKKRSHQTVLDQSSDQEIREMVISKRKNRLDQKQKFKKYRKVVIPDSDSEEQYEYVTSKKHKKPKHKNEDNQEDYSKVDLSRNKKRKYRHIKDSSESENSSLSNSKLVIKQRKPKKGNKQEIQRQKEVTSQK